MKYTHVDTPIGKLTVVAGGTGIRRILWDGEAPPEDAVEGHSDLLDAAVTQIREYFTGTRTTFDLPLDLGEPPSSRRSGGSLARSPSGPRSATASRHGGSAGRRQPGPSVRRTGATPCRSCCPATGSSARAGP